MCDHWKKLHTWRLLGVDQQAMQPQSAVLWPRKVQPEPDHEGAAS
ncbi:MAG: hypothetical protein ACK2UK_13310 [Candidatus Promineifilaceae bacterium]